MPATSIRATSQPKRPSLLSFDLRAYTGKAIVSRVVPVGPEAVRYPIEVHAPDFVRWVGTVQAERQSLFTSPGTGER